MIAPGNPWPLPTPAPETPVPGAGPGRAHQAVLAALVLIASVAVARVAWLTAIDADEVEHAHVSWLLSQGSLPYKDVHQLHTPLQWIVFAPWTGAFTSALTMLLTFRLACLLALGGAIAAGAYVASKCVRRDGLTCGLLMAIAALSWAVRAEAFRFRPDPFMACFTMLAVAALVGRSPRGSVRPFLGGLCLGIAACFSPKMFPLLLLAPGALVIDAICERRLRWREVAASIAGGATAPAAMAAWLAAHGLLALFQEGVVAHNSLLLNDSVATATIAVGPVWAVVVAGLVWWNRAGRAAVSPRPLAIVGLASVLGLLVPIFESNHYNYNYQAALVPVSVVLAVAAAQLTGVRGRWRWRQLALLAGLGALLYRPVVAEGWRLETFGTFISQRALDVVSRCASGRQEPCAGFAPWHPVTCRDASDLYLTWDYWFLTMPWVTEPAREPYRRIWRASVPRLISAAPVMILRSDLWKAAAERGAVDPAQLASLDRFIKERYTSRWVDGLQVQIRNDATACLAE